MIAVGSHGAIAALADGLAQVELPWVLPGDTGATASQDGRRIAFASTRDGSSEIYVADVATGRVSRLTDNAQAEDVEPSWSPDGRRIVWASGSPGAHDLFVMDRDGAHKHRLAGGPGNDIDPAWSPDGSRIAFASNRSGRYQLWLVGSSGGTPELLTTPGRARAPDWSPTDNRLAYTGIVRSASDVWMVSLDGFTHRRLTTAPSFDGRPNWSQDGRRLAFVSERGGARRIWLMRADGMHQRQLPGLQQADDTPSWSTLDAAIAPSASELLPDLDQRAPSGLVVMARERGTVSSASPRPSTTSVPARSTSEARVSGPLARCGRISSSTGAAAGCASCARSDGLAYEPHPPHHHWHLQPYERYELRRAGDDAFVARDTKSGFCLLDRWGHARPHPGIVPGPQRFIGGLRRRRPAGTPGRGGVLDRIHRSLPRVLPRAGDRHHGPRRRPLRAGAPGEPGADGFASCATPTMQRPCSSVCAGRAGQPSPASRSCAAARARSGALA